MRSTLHVLVSGALTLLVACGTDSSSGEDASNNSSSNNSSSNNSAANNSSSNNSAANNSTPVTPADCDGATEHRDLVVCAAAAFLETLSDEERSAVQYAWTDAAAKTRWSNLPGVDRNGLSLGELDEDSRAAALVVARTALSEEGYEDFAGILAADDYLAAQGGGGGPGGGGQYGSDNYIIAFIGAPSTSSDWMLQLGGHHMAFNISYVTDGVAPTPNHEGAEPRGSFTVDGVTYAPLDDDATSILSVFETMSDAQLSSAYLQGQTFADVLLGPDEYSTGSYDAVSFPSGANRTGVLVSSLSEDQQALVVAAIESWVRDYPDAVAEPLLEAYTSAEALADTYVAWGGSQASGPDPEVSGTYLRIDGPRVWIEVSCQSGVVIQGKTHYHMIYRDKTRDYGASL